MTSLRTSVGCDLQYLKNELNYDLLKNAKPQIEQWKKLRAFAFLEGDHLKLTLKGRLLADKLASDLFFSELETHQILKFSCLSSAYFHFISAFQFYH